MRLTIEEILSQDYDDLKRNALGEIVYEKRLKQVADNLLKHESMSSDGFQTYNEYFSALLNESCLVNGKLFKLPEGEKSEYRYVNDILINAIWTNWSGANRVFISAGTGRGKNTFIKKELLPHIGDAKVVIFENRDSLMQQQVVDIISEIDPEILMYRDLTEENMVIFGSQRNIMLISYQLAAIKCASRDQEFFKFCQGASYFVFDEAHYVLDDAQFNKGINFFVNVFLNPAFNLNAVKIFMSGSMEEFYAFTQTLQPFSDKPNDIYEEKKLLELKGNDPSHKLFRELSSTVNGCHVLSMPTDYSYIKPYKYKKLADICSQIEHTATDEKWLIFVKSISEGAALQSSLKSICGASICFLDASNKNGDENDKIYKQLVHESKFDCRVMIATTVIYNGINIKDESVKHIVVPFTTISVVKQLIGRKRMNVNENVNVYFPDETDGRVRKRYYECIKDYMELMTLRSQLPLQSLFQLNGLSYSKPSKFYYLEPQTVSSNNVSIKMLLPQLNIPSIQKLFYDTCFYIFTLHKMSSMDFPSIILSHLGIADQIDQMIDISCLSKEEERDAISQKLADYLEGLIDKPITSPDENGSYDALLDLKREINEAHKALHSGKNLDTQWKNKERFFADEKIKALLEELSLPYRIESKSNNGQRIVTVTRK